MILDLVSWILFRIPKWSINWLVCWVLLEDAPKPRHRSDHGWALARARTGGTGGAGNGLERLQQARRVGFEGGFNMFQLQKSQAFRLTIFECGAKHVDKHADKHVDVNNTSHKSIIKTMNSGAVIVITFSDAQSHALHFRVKRLPRLPTVSEPRVSAHGRSHFMPAARSVRGLGLHQRTLEKSNDP